MLEVVGGGVLKIRVRRGLGGVWLAEIDLTDILVNLDG